MNFDYIAGFFDGEGCIHRSHRIRPSKRNRDHPIIELTMCNTNREVVENIRAFVGCGHIEVRNRPRCKPLFVFQIGGWREVLRLAQELEPHCIVKKIPLQRIIAFIKGHPWIHGDVSTLTKENLTEYYLRRKWSLTQVAKRYGVSPMAVYDYLHRNGIPVRSRAEAWRVRGCGRNGKGQFTGPLSA